MAITLTRTFDTYDAANTADRTVMFRGYINWDSSYPTGGEAISVSMLNTAIVAARHAGCTCSALVDVVPGIPADGSIWTCFDAANSKVLAFVGTTGAQVGNGVDISNVSYKTPVTIWATKS